MALMRIDPASGSAEAVFAPDRDVEAWSLSSAGVLATIENDRGYSVLRVGPRDGERAVVGLPPGVVADLAWSPDGALLAFSFAAPTMPGGIWLWEGGAVRPVWQPDCAVPVEDFALVDWTSFDGQRVPGWFALPAGAAARCRVARRRLGPWRPGGAGAGGLPRGHAGAAETGLCRADAECARQHRLRPRLYG